MVVERGRELGDLARRAEVREDLGKRGEVGAAVGGLAQQALGLREVPLDVLPRVQLADRDAHRQSIGRARRCYGFWTTTPNRSDEMPGNTSVSDPARQRFSRISARIRR